MALVVAAVALLATAAGFVFLVANWSRVTNDLQNTVAAMDIAAAPGEVEVGESSTLLLGVAGDDGRLGALALLAVEDETSSLSVIPTALFELLPGYGEFQLADSLLFEGPELAGLTVANALGVRVDEVVVVAADAFAAATGELEIEVSVPIVDTAAGTELLGAGIARLDGATAYRLLANQFDSTAVQWLERQAQIWASLIDRVAADGSVATQLVAEEEAAGILRGLVGSEGEVNLIPVTPVAVAGGADGFQLSQAEVSAFVARELAPVALSEGPSRPRVEVLNGNGELLATRAVVRELVASGFHVLKTDNADTFDYTETVIIAQGRDNQPAAQRVASAIGVSQVQLEAAAPSGVVDVSVIVGDDIAVPGS